MPKGSVGSAERRCRTAGWLGSRLETDPPGDVNRLRGYVRVAHQLGFSTMPILWNGNTLNPDLLQSAFRAGGEVCVNAIVEGVKDEPGLLMGDVMDEPFTNDCPDHATAWRSAPSPMTWACGSRSVASGMEGSLRALSVQCEWTRDGAGGADQGRAAAGKAAARDDWRRVGFSPPF